MYTAKLDEENGEIVDQEPELDEGANLSWLP